MTHAPTTGIMDANSTQLLDPDPQKTNRQEQKEPTTDNTPFFLAFPFK